MRLSTLLWIALVGGCYPYLPPGAKPGDDVTVGGPADPSTPPPVTDPVVEGLGLTELGVCWGALYLRNDDDTLALWVRPASWWLWEAESEGGLPVELDLPNEEFLWVELQEGEQLTICEDVEVRMDRSWSGVAGAVLGEITPVGDHTVRVALTLTDLALEDADGATVEFDAVSLEGVVEVPGA